MDHNKPPSQKIAARGLLADAQGQKGINALVLILVSRRLLAAMIMLLAVAQGYS